MDTLEKAFRVKYLGYAHWFMSIIISQMKDHSISVDQDRYSTSIVKKYLDNSIVKASKKFHKTNFPYDIISTKADAYTSDEQVEKLTNEFNINYISCIGSLIYLLYKRVNLNFLLYKLTKFLSNPAKVHFEGFVHILGYIRENKTLALKYYADMNDALVSDLSRKSGIKNENQLMDFYDYSCQYCIDTGISTGAYIIFDQPFSGMR